VNQVDGTAGLDGDALWHRGVIDDDKYIHTRPEN
jgi:hypothetical protein